jgi:hypothetical protein
MRFFKLMRNAALAAAMLAGGAAVTIDDAAAQGRHHGARQAPHRSYAAPRGYSPRRMSFAPQRYSRRPSPPRGGSYTYAPRYYGSRVNVYQRSYAPRYYGGATYVTGWVPGGWYDQYGRYCVYKWQWEDSPWGWRKVRRTSCRWL